MKKHTFFHDLFFVLSANGIGLILSVVINLLLPKIFSTDIGAYGYVQLYLLYVSYYYIFTLGICNGIYLKEGGNRIEDLSSKSYSSQFALFAVLQIVCGTAIGVCSLVFCNDVDKKFVFAIIGINIIIMGIREFFSMIFQATSKIRDYSIMTIISKCINATVIIIALISSIKDYKVLVMLLTAGELCSLIYALVRGKKLVSCKPKINKEIIKETISNIKSGSSILISGMTAMLITGFAKLCVENHWGIETFAKISFTISIANLFMVFANAASIVLYPRLKNIDLEKCNQSYRKLNRLIVLLLFFAIGFCYPAKLALQIFLPEYKEALFYISILLPMCVFIGKTTMATQTYMKALRLEKQLMISNLISFIISSILVIISVYVLDNITFTVFSILIGQILRAVLCEMFLARTIKINVIKNTIIECLITAFFVLTHWMIGGWIGSIVYLTIIALYFVVVFIDTKIHKEKIENGEE